METKIYSSVKEVLESRILEQQVRYRHKRETSSTASITASLSASYTAGMAPTNCATSSAGNYTRSSPSVLITTVERVRLSSSPPPQEIDLSEMTVEDMKRLKIEDPFMYYSIPEVHTRSYQFEEYNATEHHQQDEVEGPPQEEADGNDNLEDDPQYDDQAEAGNVSSSNRRPFYRGPLSASMPAGLLANAEIARAALERQQQAQQPQENVVKLRRRISVEAHPILACAGMARTLSEGQDEGGLDEEDLFLRVLMENTRTEIRIG